MTGELDIDYPSPVSDEERSVTSDDILGLRAQVDQLTRDSRIPFWRTPEGKAEKARLRRNKAQRNARKRARRS
jgi:hypothetical protein